MLRKFFVLLYKDSLLVIKDKTGMGFLFIMPVTLVFIMTVLQENAYKTLDNSSLKLVVLNSDKDSLGNDIVVQLKTSGVFDVYELEGDKKDSTSVEQLVAKGKYKAGIIIPDSITLYMRLLIKQKLSEAFDGKDNKTGTNAFNMPEVEIFFDPVIRASYMIMIKSMLREFNSNFKTKLLLKELNKSIPFMESEIKINNVIRFKERYASTGTYSVIPNTVQHNVPAWMLFAMFFIVISLAGNMVKEREDGSFARLQFMPMSYWLYILSKVTVYIFVCMVQFVLMLSVGVFLMPLIGFPALQTGDSILSLFLMALVSSMAATGFGIFTGTITRSYQQAATFGSLSIIILSAIGGIWVPVFMMPKGMQVISKVSPLNWGIEGFYNILVRGLPLHDSIGDMFLLTMFFIVTMAASVLIYSKWK